MGRRLLARQLCPDLIVSSPAVRATETAKIIAAELSYPAENIQFEIEIYEAYTETLFDVIQKFDDKHSNIFMIGHNPAMTSLCERISGVFVDNMPTCGIFSVKLDIQSWKETTRGSGEFLFFDYPKNR